MSTFNAADFVNIEINTVLERRPPLPVGDYMATIGEVTCVPWQKKDDPSKSGLRYVVPLKLMIPPEVQTDLGLSTDNIKLSDSIMLDMTDGGTLDTSPGKNSGLRRYREALDMNKPGESFSARKMFGQLILVKLSHDMYQGEIQERISGIAKAV